MKKLHLDDPNFNEKFREAIGVGPDDPIQIITPQFERTPDMPPAAAAPSNRMAWEALRHFSKDELKAWGCAPWDAPDADGLVLMLFPGEWYDDIPEGYELVSINDRVEPFVRGETDNDIRFGCLAYGIKVRG